MHQNAYKKTYKPNSHRIFLTEVYHPDLSLIAPNCILHIEKAAEVNENIIMKDVRYT